MLILATVFTLVGLVSLACQIYSGTKGKGDYAMTGVFVTVPFSMTGAILAQMA